MTLRSWILLAALMGLLVVPFPLAQAASPRSASGLDGMSGHALSSSIPTAGPTTGWSTFLGSPSRSSYSSYPGITSVQTAWISCFTNQSIRIGPVVAGNEVIAADNLGHIFALNNSENGTLLWGQNLDTLVTELDVAGSTLLVGDSFGSLYALSTTSGAEEWTQRLNGGIVQAPLDLNGTAYVGTTTGDIVALNVTTGAIRWTTSLGAGIGGALAEANGTLLAVTSTGTIEALSLTGQTQWTVSTGASVVTALSVGEGMVLAGTLARTVQAYALTNGSSLWSFGIPSPNRTASEVRSTPALGDGLVVVQTPNGDVWALNASNGLLQWNDSFPEYGGVNVAGPVVTPSAIYAIDSGDGTLFGLSPANGSVLWTSGIGSADTSNAFPAIDQGDILLGTELGCVAEYSSAVPAFT
ncbi:MAG: PQQ-binding-like beta-propeller repeat protein, partial [Thermoplasmata archaeon]